MEDCSACKVENAPTGSPWEMLMNFSIKVHSYYSGTYTIYSLEFKIIRFCWGFITISFIKAIEALIKEHNLGKLCYVIAKNYKHHPGFLSLSE